MDIQTTSKLVDIPHDTARILISVRVDGEEVFNYVLVSGPREPVTDYFNNKISLGELRAKIYRNKVKT